MARGALLTAVTMLACAGGDETSGNRIEIESGIVVFDGSTVTASVSLRLDGGENRELRVGAVPDHLICGRSLGWRFDDSSSVPAASSSDPSRRRLRATSGGRVLCDTARDESLEPVASCGEPITLVITDADEVVLATFATTYQCLFRLG